MECINCGSNNVSVDDTRAECICENCGFISEFIDSHQEPEFEVMNNGRIAATGNIISTNRQKTINKISAKIDNLCSKLSLTKSLATDAVNIFKTALSLGMTTGRNGQVMAGACVYLAARINQQNLMMLDVSDQLAVNVYRLGKTYRELKRNTGHNVCEVDPCLFITRFALELKLGDKTEQISQTAVKLLRRMKKDWVNTTKRPAGIAAAALLIAARLYRFNLECSDLTKIAGVSRDTILKRMEEWTETSTAELTWSQFLKIDKAEVSENGGVGEEEEPASRVGNGDRQPVSLTSYDSDLGVGDSDDEELEKAYLCSKEETAMKMKWWLDRHPEFHKNSKKNEEKIEVLRRKWEEGGVCPPNKKQKQGEQQLEEKDDLSCEVEEEHEEEDEADYDYTEDD